MRARRLDGRGSRVYVSDVDCLCCGRWFVLDTIAAHLVRERRRRGKRKVSAAIDEHLAQWWIDRMTKFPKPPSAREAEQDQFADFLKAKHVGKEGARATLVIAGKPRLHKGPFGEQAIIPVKFGGKVYDFAIGTDKPNYSILYKQLGDPNKWKGKINVVVVATARGNGTYLAVEV